jgi:heme exporter protein A
MRGYNPRFFITACDSMLEAQQLAAQRGTATLFANVDFSLENGEMLVVTGANGSGKTTLLRIASGLSRAAHGALKWRGIAVAPFDAELRASVLYIGHATALKDEFTAEENLLALASLHGAPGGERAAVRQALGAWSLDRQSRLPARVLSQGQRRRIALARLNLIRRPLWVLDEPASAIDAAGVAQLEHLIASHLSTGGIAVIATHHDLAIHAGRKPVLRLS